MSTITIGVDLAKSVFSVCEVDAAGHVLSRQDLRCDAFSIWLAQKAAGTVVAMEACSGAHHWARRCLEYGLQPRIMAAQFVTPFRKGRRTKNDRADAEAIATAARQGNMRFVPVKSIEQQARLSWYRIREGYKAESLALGNRARGLLAELGIVVAQSDVALRRALADLDTASALPAEFKELLRDLAAHWAQLRERIDTCGARIDAHARQDERCARPYAIIGIGPITADVAVATVGNAREFKHGRQMAAWLGLVPTQHSSGGRARLGMISCRGDAYLRTLLIQGTQQLATGQSCGARKGHAGAAVDTVAGRTHALRQSAGRHRQQTRPADLGDVGARGGFWSACECASPHAPAGRHDLSIRY